MVKFQTSLLAITLASTSSAAALASTNEYQRRDLSGTHFQYGLTAAGRLGSRGFIDEEDLFVRDIDAFDSTLEARGPGIGELFKRATQHERNSLPGVLGQILADHESHHAPSPPGHHPASGSAPHPHHDSQAPAHHSPAAGSSANDSPAPAALHHDSPAFNSARPPSPAHSRRDLEDNVDIFERDLDVEELFGREYDLLDERDTIDNEDLFVRDLEAEELFGREYDLLDEQYY